VLELVFEKLEPKKMDKMSKSIKQNHKVVGLISALILSMFTVCGQDGLYTGKVKSVLDGDTYIVTENGTGDELRVRLIHIDCPESNQEFGKEATEYAKSRVLGRTVKILSTGLDQYGRVLGLVVEENGNIFNYELLTMGYAWHYAKYSSDISASALEQFARQSKSGLWINDDAVAPWKFRN